MSESLEQQKRPPVRGRGTSDNPAGRFEKLAVEWDPDSYEQEIWAEGESPEQGRQLKTEIFRDFSKTIISTNDSPDIGMEATLNPYRGCEHGCIYCYARPTHEYLGMSAGLDFETKIFAKPDAPQLLAQKLSSTQWQPKVVTLSGVTDCYQPVEKTMKLTRGCLEVLRDFRNPAAIITKNFLVTRDIDIFKQMAAYNGIKVNLSVTTLEPGLCRAMEPRASTPGLRLKAIEMLAGAGIPVGIMIGPVLPGLTEHEIPRILEAVANAGARSANYTMLRLPYGVKELFQTWLAEHYPDRARKVVARVRDVREGRLNDATFGTRMRGTGVYAQQIEQIFKLSRKRYGLDQPYEALSTTHFRRDAHDAQLSLF